MKYRILVLILICGITACKKTRTCNCSINRTGVITRTDESAGLSLPAIPGLPTLPTLPGTSSTTNEDYNITTSEVSTFDKVSKNDMHAACPKHSEEMIYDRNVVSAAGSFTSTTVDTGTKTTDCTIK